MQHPGAEYPLLQHGKPNANKPLHQYYRMCGGKPCGIHSVKLGAALLLLLLLLRVAAASGAMMMVAESSSLPGLRTLGCSG